MQGRRVCLALSAPQGRLVRTASMGRPGHKDRRATRGHLDRTASMVRRVPQASTELTVSTVPQEPKAILGYRAPTVLTVHVGRPGLMELLAYRAPEWPQSQAGSSSLSAVDNCPLWALGLQPQ